MKLIRKKQTVIQYDKNALRPVIRSSICTGEKVAGFKDIKTGKFSDVMLIRDDKDLKTFKDMYGVDEIEKEY